MCREMVLPHLCAWEARNFPPSLPPYRPLSTETAAHPPEASIPTPVVSVSTDQGVSRQEEEKEEDVYVNVSIIPKTPEGAGGRRYEAVYDYESETDGDLNFFVGDIIEVWSHSKFFTFPFPIPIPENSILHSAQVVESEGAWWTGVLNGVKGVFPSNYVQPYAPPSPSPYPSSSADPSNVTVLPKPLIARVIVGGWGSHVHTPYML